MSKNKQKQFSAGKTNNKLCEIKEIASKKQKSVLAVFNENLKNLSNSSSFCSVKKSKSKFKLNTNIDFYMSFEDDANSHISEFSDPVKCFLRIRPVVVNQLFNNTLDSIANTNNEDISPYTLDQEKKQISFKDQKFIFNKVFDETSNQMEIWQLTAKPLIDDFLNNFKSGLIFAYGVSGSGKTHTIFGTEQDQGMIPISLMSTFCKLKELKEQEKEVFSQLELFCSFVEIYNEEIYDLLNPNQIKIEIRERENKNFFMISKLFN